MKAVLSAPRVGRSVPSRPCVLRNAHRVVTRSSRLARTTVIQVHAISAPEKSEPEVTKRVPSIQAAEEEDLGDNSCGAVVDRDGDFIEVMCCDYGFRSGSGRMYQEQDGRIPSSAWQLGVDNFNQELKALRRSVRFNEYSKVALANPAKSIPGKVVYWMGQGLVAALAGLDFLLEKTKILPLLAPKRIPDDLIDQETGDLTKDCKEIRQQLAALQLSNDAVWDRERKREEAGGGVEGTPFLVKSTYLVLCYLLDVMFENRPIQRFWFLETVARMPYFSYITLLHLYESFGWWRAGAELRKVHFAEEWNELHHLQIMESLGGDQLWFDRFLAFHSAIVYYWLLCAIFVFSPALAYNFSELIEAHAVDTYGEFVDANEDLLKSLPPPMVAVKYYRTGDLYMFDEFQTSQVVRNTRRPECNTLYDVFVNIRDDEGEHVKTMKACQDTTIADQLEQRRDAEPGA